MTIRDLRVIEVNIHGMTGYQVYGIWRACSDSFWEDIVHAAVFRDQARAENFLTNVVKKKPFWEFDMNHWGKPADYYVSSADYKQTKASVYSVL